MTVGDIASIVSIVLAIVAIALSITFFRMSSQLSEATKNASDRIGASVDRLEKLFDKLYSDTFALMKDTYQDMREHAWPEGTKVGDKVIAEAEKKTDEKLDILKQNLAIQLDKVLDNQIRTEAEVTKVKDSVRDLVGRAITESRKAEEQAREETMREHIVRQLKVLVSPEGYVRADTIVKSLTEKFPGTKIVHELVKMRDDGIISYQGGGLGPTTEIRLEKS
jgi:phage terminase small subunit